MPNPIGPVVSRPRAFGGLQTERLGIRLSGRGTRHLDASQNTGIREEYTPETASQWEEFRADSIALWLMSGMPVKASDVLIMDSLTGALVAAISLAQHDGAWRHDATSTHPGWLNRGLVLVDVALRMLNHPSTTRHAGNAFDVNFYIAMHRSILVSAAIHAERQECARTINDSDLLLVTLDASSSIRTSGGLGGVAWSQAYVRGIIGGD